MNGWCHMALTLPVKSIRRGFLAQRQKIGYRLGLLPTSGDKFVTETFYSIVPVSPVLTYQNLVAMTYIIQVKIGSIFQKGGSQTSLIYESAPHGRPSLVAPYCNFVYSKSFAFHRNLFCSSCCPDQLFAAQRPSITQFPYSQHFGETGWPSATSLDGRYISPWLT